MITRNEDEQTNTVTYDFDFTIIISALVITALILIYFTLRDIRAEIRINNDILIERLEKKVVAKTEVVIPNK